MPFFIIFLVIPFVEISVFIAVGEKIGLFTTLGLAFLTAIIGGAIIRHQGLHILSTARAQLGDNMLPVQEIFDGFCLVAAGALLITPGFVTDFIGFTLLVPQARIALRSAVGQHFNFQNHTHNAGPVPGNRASRPPPGVIEGEFEDLTQDKNEN